MHLINVQGGGILLPLDGTISGTVRLSFEWLERVSEEPPWYFVPDPPDAKWREPFTENEVETLQAVYATKLEQCLALNDSKGFGTICEDMIRSVINFTQFGSQEGLREARLILLARPFTLVWSTLDKLIYGVDHCHILHVVVVVYEELARKTRGFRDESFDPLRDKSLRLLNEQWGSLGMSHSWCQVLIDRFLSMREYRATAHLYLVVDELCRETWEQLTKIYGSIDLHTHRQLGNFEAALALARSPPNYDYITNIQLAKTKWTGTSGKVTAVVTSSEDLYSPPDDDLDSLLSDGSTRVCVVCGRRT